MTNTKHATLYTKPEKQINYIATLAEVVNETSAHLKNLFPQINLISISLRCTVSKKHLMGSSMSVCYVLRRTITTITLNSLLLCHYLDCPANVIAHDIIERITLSFTVLLRVHLSTLL